MIRNIVEYDHDRKQDDEDERYLIDALLDLALDVAPDRPLNEEQQDESAVENRDRQQMKIPDSS